MNTFVLIMSLMSGAGGVSISQIEFRPTESGPTSEELCKTAGEVWKNKNDSFSVDARYVCIKK